MARALRGLLILLFVVPAAPVLVGCSDPGKPNPDLQVPDVPPGDRGTSGKAPFEDKDKK